jgi:hypothetical protein
MTGCTSPNTATRNRLDDAKVHWTALAGRPRAARGTVHCWTSLTAIAVHCCTFASEACQAGLRPHPIPRSTAKRWWNKVKPERISRSGCLGRIEPWRHSLSLLRTDVARAPTLLQRPSISNSAINCSMQGALLGRQNSMTGWARSAGTLGPRIPRAGARARTQRCVQRMPHTFPAANCYRTNNQDAIAARTHLSDLKVSQFGRTTFPYVAQW